jgi:geranylgeranyl transferase type-2 subunit alpha
MPDPDWRFELRTVEGLLEKDARNCRSSSLIVDISLKMRTVHGWDYRRYMVSALKRAPDPPAYSTRKRPKPTTASELAYTTSKISASFSNYSAWHYRSKLLPILWQEKGFQAGSADIRASIDEGALC